MDPSRAEHSYFAKSRTVGANVLLKDDGRSTTRGQVGFWPCEGAKRDLPSKRWTPPRSPMGCRIEFRQSVDSRAVQGKENCPTDRAC